MYYTNFPGSSSNPAGWTALDLRTGETIWTKDTTDLLKYGQILDMVNPNQFGGIAYLWAVPSGQGGFGAQVSTLKLFDAMTGNYILSIENASTMNIVSDEGGNLIGYYVNNSVANQYNCLLY